MPVRNEDWNGNKPVDDEVMWPSGDRTIGKSMPLSKTGWHPRRAFTLRRCDFSGDLIMPFAKAYRQQIFWGLANAETHSELEEKWLTPTSYTFKKLNDTL